MAELTSLQVASQIDRTIRDFLESPVCKQILEDAVHKSVVQILPGVIHNIIGLEIMDAAKKEVKNFVANKLKITLVEDG